MLGPHEKLEKPKHFKSTLTDEEERAAVKQNPPAIKINSPNHQPQIKARVSPYVHYKQNVSRSHPHVEDTLKQFSELKPPFPTDFLQPKGHLEVEPAKHRHAKAAKSVDSGIPVFNSKHSDSIFSHQTKHTDHTLSSNLNYSKLYSPRQFVDEKLSAIMSPMHVMRGKSDSPNKKPYQDRLVQIKYGIVRDMKGLQKSPKKDIWNEDNFENSKYLDQIERKQREIILKYALPKKHALEQRKLERLFTSKHYSKVLSNMRANALHDDWEEWISSIKQANEYQENGL